MGVEVLRGQKGHPKPALDHVKGGGGAAGAADDVRLKARPAAGGEAQLRGHLAGLVENEVLPLSSRRLTSSRPARGWTRGTARE